MNSIDFVELLKEKNREAVSELYDKYAPTLYGVILRIVKSNEKAEGLLEQTFLQILEDIHTYHNHTSFFTWMFRKAKTIACESVALSILQDAIEGNNMVEHGLAEVDCTEWLAGLDEQSKAVLNHMCFQGRTLAESSRVLNISTDEIKKQLRYAFSHVHSKLNAGLKATAFIAVIVQLLLF